MCLIGDAVFKQDQIFKFNTFIWINLSKYFLKCFHTPYSYHSDEISVLWPVSLCHIKLNINIKIQYIQFFYFQWERNQIVMRGLSQKATLIHFVLMKDLSMSYYSQQHQHRELSTIGVTSVVT